MDTPLDSGDSPAARTRRILCIGVTPCLQRTLRFPTLALGEVNRVRSVASIPSGKATNVARVLRTLAADPLLIGFAGGSAGDQLCASLAEEGLDARWIRVAGETRTCQTLIDEASGHVTELVEEAPLPGEDEWTQLEAAVDRILGSVHQVVISGRLPPGASPETYARLVRLAKGRGVPVLVDTQSAALTRAVAAGPLLAKINHAELVEATGGERATDVLDLGAEWVLITRGPEPAVLAGAAGQWAYTIPDVDVVNPIGSGDATMAGTAHGLSLGQSMPEAVALGLACGCANAMTETPGEVRPTEVRDLAARIRMDPA